MNGVKRWAVVAMGLCVLFASTGCQDGRDEQIKALQDQLQGCLGDKERIAAELDRLNRSGGDAASRALQLQQMVDELTRRNNDLQGQLNGCQSQLASARNQPAPAPRQEGEWIFAGPYAWTNIAEDILFDSGRAELKSSGRAKLQQIAGDLRSKFGGKAYWVIGHTDTDPIRKSGDKWMDNLHLSQARGRVVALELIKLGIASQEVIAGGQGEWNPLTSNASEAGKSKNRRVTIMAVDRPQRVGPSALVPVGSGTRG